MNRTHKIIFIILIIYLVLPGYMIAQNLERQIYTLNQLLDSAVANNFNIKSTLLNNDISYAKIDALAKNYQPEISASSNFSYYDWLMPSKAKILGGDVNTDMLVQITASQLIYDWGLNKQKKQLEQSDISINEQFTRQLKQNIIWIVSQSYFDALKIKKTIAVLENSKKQLTEQLSITENLYSIGKVSNVDVSKIKLNIAINDKELQTTQNQYKEELSILKNLALLKKSKIDIIDRTYEWFAQINGLENYYTFDSIFSNPTLKMIDEKIAKERKQKLLVKKQNRPQLFSYALTNWEHAYIPFGANFNYSVGINFRYTIPYFGGSSYKENMLISEIKQSQFRDVKKQTYWNLKKEIDAVLIQIQNKKQEIRSNIIITKLSEDTYNNVKLNYESGQEMILDVIVAQTTLTKQDILYKKSLIEYLELLSKLNYLYGGDKYIF